MKKHKLYLIFLVCIVLVLTFSSCKTKKDDDEIAQPYIEQAADKNDATEQQTEKSDTDKVKDTVNTGVPETSEPVTDQEQQTPEEVQTTEEESPEQQDSQSVADEEKSEEKSTEVFGEGILEYIDISKVAKLEFECPGEALSNVTLQTVKTVTAADDIKKVIDTLSQISYTEKQKLFEEGEFVIAEPTAYRLTLYDADGKYICYLDLKRILNNKNTVLVKNYNYTIEDSAKIDALITENIRSNCDCYICTTETLVSSQDCEICKQDKSKGKFCKCEK